MAVSLPELPDEILPVRAAASSSGALAEGIGWLERGGLRSGPLKNSSPKKAG
jgi:hypothetical protein